MIKLVKNVGNEVTTAIIQDSKYDAVKHIGKVYMSRTKSVAPRAERAIMANKYVGNVNCHGVDNYDRDIGEREAVKKVIRNHQRGLRRAIIRWQVVMLQDIRAVNPDTFDIALNKLHSCKCKQAE